MKIFPLLIGVIFGFSTSPDKKYDSEVTQAKNNAINIGWKILFSQDITDNSVISPLSIIGAMYMLAAGTGGTSQEEILKALDYREVKDDLLPFHAYKKLIDGVVNDNPDSYTLQLANGAFHQSFMPNGELGKAAIDRFTGILLEDFVQDMVNIQEVDFMQDPEGTTDTINQWINKTTNGKIPELYKEPLEQNTLMVLASSLYFRGSWQSKFEEVSTDETDAICWQSTKQQMHDAECNDDVSFMTQTSTFNIYNQVNKFKVIEIPMKEHKEDGFHNKFTMLIWLPEGIIDDEPRDKELQDFIINNSGNIRTKLRSKRVKLTLPKFSLDANMDLVSHMQNLGIHEVFSSGNFTPMFGEGMPECYVSQINHGIKLDVDESGVEGAAVTTVQISFRSGMDPERLDILRPFYFSISNRCWDNKQPHGDGRCSYGNVPIFVGKVVTPKI